MGNRIYFERKYEGHREMGFKAPWIYVELIQKHLWHDKSHCRCSLPAIKINSLDFIAHIIQFQKDEYGHWARVWKEVSSGESSRSYVVWGKIRQGRNHSGVLKQLDQGLISADILISDDVLGIITNMKKIKLR